jgi:N-acetylneuraminic acid mutarotase
MPTYTISADASNGYCWAGGASSGGVVYVGQDTSNKYQIGLAFDTSSVVGTITSVTLRTYLQISSGGPGFIVEARLFDWGSTLTSSDWTTGGSLGSQTLLASYPANSMTGGSYDVYTSEAAFLTSINQSGMTRMTLTSSRQRNGDVPSGSEYRGLYGQSGGSGFWPTLTIVTSTSTVRPIAGQADLAISTTGTAVTTYVALDGAGSFSAYARRISGSVWEPVVPMPSGGRYEVESASIGGKLYALGGWSTGSVVSSGVRVEAYDPTLNVWTAKAPMPGIRTGGGVTVVGSYLYYVGGYNPFVGGPTTNLWRYDPAANTWATMAVITPTPTSYLTVAIGDPINGRLYCCTGESTTLYIYDIATDVWSTATKPTMLIPSGTWHTNGKAYFSSTLSWTTAPSHMFEYDPTLATFTEKATHTNRYASAMFSFDGQVWMAGGNATAGVAPYQSVESYDPTTNTWTVHDDLTIPRVAFGGDVVDGHPIVVGGYSPYLPYPDYALASAERYALPQDSSVEFDFVLDQLYPMKLAKAELDLGLELDGDTRIDPQRMNPGFVHIGHRPVGYRDRRYFRAVPNSNIPLPQADDPDIWIGDGDRTLPPHWLDEYAYVTSADQRYLYVICGYFWNVHWNQWWSDRLYRWDALMLTWTELASLPDHVGSEGCNAGRIGDKIYVLMGDTGWDDVEPFGVGGSFPDPEWLLGPALLQSMWVYDIPGDTWTRGTQPPFAQDYGGAAVLDGKFYAIPDWDGVVEMATGNGSVNTAYVYDPVANSWTQLDDMPISSSSDVEMLFAGNGLIWALGSVSGGSGWIPVLLSFDPGTGTWTVETGNFTGIELAPRYGSAILQVSDTVVRLVGGGSGASSQTTVEIDLVAKTITDLNAFQEGDNYWGGSYYNGTMFITTSDDDFGDVWSATS